MIKKGERLPKPKEPKLAGLIVNPPLPDEINLAECRNPEFAARQWLCSKDWPEARLRWHDAPPRKEPANAAALDLSYQTGGWWLWNNLAYLDWKIEHKAARDERDGPDVADGRDPLRAIPRAS